MLFPVYEVTKPFFIYLQSSFCYYSHHPNCIPSSFSFSKSKLIFSKYILNFPFIPSSKYCYRVTTQLQLTNISYHIFAIIFAVCEIRLIVRWSLHFEVCVFFFKAIIVTSVKSLGHSPVSYMVLIYLFIVY